MNKKQLIVAWLILMLVFSGCGSYDGGSYNEGYDDGYDGEEMRKFSSKDYQAGYEDGRQDVYYFELGHQDARNEEEPRYPDIEMYMEGYGEG